MDHKWKWTGHGHFYFYAKKRKFDTRINVFIYSNSMLRIIAKLLDLASLILTTLSIVNCSIRYFTICFLYFPTFSSFYFLNIHSILNINLIPHTRSSLMPFDVHMMNGIWNPPLSVLTFCRSSGTSPLQDFCCTFHMSRVLKSCE